MTLGKYLSDELFAAGEGMAGPGSNGDSSPWPQEQPAGKNGSNGIILFAGTPVVRCGALGRDTPRRQGSRRDHASSTTNKRARAPSAGGRRPWADARLAGDRATVLAVADVRAPCACRRRTGTGQRTRRTGKRNDR
jgi:hypothetical protein